MKFPIASLRNYSNSFKTYLTQKSYFGIFLLSNYDFGVPVKIVLTFTTKDAACLFYIEKTSNSYYPCHCVIEPTQSEVTSRITCKFSTVQFIINRTLIKLFNYFTGQRSNIYRILKLCNTKIKLYLYVVHYIDSLDNISTKFE